MSEQEKTILTFVKRIVPEDWECEVSFNESLRAYQIAFPSKGLITILASQLFLRPELHPISKTKLTALVAKLLRNL